MWLRLSMCIVMVLVSPVIILFGSSYSCFPLRNLIPSLFLLVFGIIYTFGFTLTLCVGMCNISGYFTASSCVFICLLFPPIFSSTSILSNLYSCTGDGSYFPHKSNLLSFISSFLHSP